VPVARAGRRVIGIDFSKEMLRKAERVTRDAGMHDRCHFLHADILQNLPEALNRHKPYDAVAILGVFEYMSDPLPVLRTARQFEPQRIVASLPRSGTFRSTLRHSTSLKFLPNPNMLLRWPAVDSSSS
jgi:2-polyprenyl-3-methyl-5-hydroxy-6-metoxy-1,4-benzoquinol methylase